MLLEWIRDKVKEVTGLPTAIEAWTTVPSSDYCVVGLDMVADRVIADAEVVQESPHGTIDLFAHCTDTTKAELITHMFDGLDDITLYRNTIQYENANRLIHWEWVWTASRWDMDEDND